MQRFSGLSGRRYTIFALLLMLLLLMNTTQKWIVLALIAGVLQSCGANEPKGSKEVAEEKNEQRFTADTVQKDLEFAVEMASRMLMHAQMGNMMGQKAQSPKVKSVALTLETEHNMTVHELQTLARQQQISLPAVAGSEEQEQLAEMNQQQGADLDKKYLNFILDDHQKMLKKFEAQAAQGSNEPLQIFALAKSGRLKQHISMIEEVKKGLDY